MADGYGSPPGSRVLIADTHPELADLMKMVLDDEGYQTIVAADWRQIVAEAGRASPDLVVLGLPREQDDAFALLDALRADAATEAIPVVTTATAEALAHGALASYNVRATLTKPFDLDQLLAAVRQAIGQPQLHASAPPAPEPPEGVALAAAILSRYSRAVLFLWVQRLRQEPAWHAREDEPLPNVLDATPLLVETLGLMLERRDPDPEHLFHDMPVALDRVREHARTRQAQGIPLTTVVREYTLLRNEIWRLFRRHLPAQIDTATLLDVEQRINLTLDRIVEVTIADYIGAMGDR